MKKPFYVLLLVFLSVFMIGSFKQTDYVHAEGEVEYTFTVNVTVPENTPTNVAKAKVALVGTVNGWTPGHADWILTKDAENDYLYSITKTITLTDPTIKFKFVIGDDWSFVEKTADDEDVPDREFTLSATEPNVFNLTVEKWAAIPTDDPVSKIGTVVVHYQNFLGEYDDSGAHSWNFGSIETQSYPRRADGVDPFGAYWEIPIGSDSQDQIGLILLKKGMDSGTQWDHKEYSQDLFVPLKAIKDNWATNQTEMTMHVYYFQGTDQFFIARPDVVNVLVAYYDPTGAYEENLGLHLWEGWVGAYGDPDFSLDAITWDKPYEMKNGFKSDADVDGKVAMLYLTPGSNAGLIVHAGDDKKSGGADVMIFQDYEAGEVVQLYVIGGQYFVGENAAEDFREAAFTFGFVPISIGDKGLNGTYAPNPKSVIVKFSLAVPTVQLDEEGKPVLDETTKLPIPLDVKAFFKVYEAEEVDGVLTPKGNPLTIERIDYNQSPSTTSVKEFVVQLAEGATLDNTKRYIITFENEDYDASIEIDLDRQAPNLTFADITFDGLIKITQGSKWDQALFPSYRAMDVRDGDVSKYVYVKEGEGILNTDEVGEYTIKLTAIDNWGNETQISFVVQVVEGSSSDCSSASAIYILNLLAIVSVLAFVLRKRNA
ncbi:MAG TPA: hypothetical protein GXZ57_04120 [Acholeplasmataceae bacterium]|mgnify:CR=1 FL=1|jgi:hypothetical protein|nr:hypothetical protein [Acholeplasmataceae bacterium]